MTMNKFQKRLSKLSKNHNNIIVVGQCFGNLKEILTMYNTVFVIDDTYPEIKAKNLVYREDCSSLSQLSEISLIVFDLATVSKLELLKEVWKQNTAIVVIEGNEPIGREFSKSLYDTEWGCTAQYGSFHTWTKIK